METNTVLLDLREYNKLRDFYNGIKDGKFVCANLYDEDVYYIKEVKILERYKNRVSFLKNNLDKLSCKVISLKKEIGNNKIRTQNPIKIYESKTKKGLPKKGWLKIFLKL